MLMVVKDNVVFAGMVKVADTLALGCEMDVAVIVAVCAADVTAGAV